jgi:hypothetical protein
MGQSVLSAFGNWKIHVAIPVKPNPDTHATPSRGHVTYWQLRYLLPTRPLLRNPVDPPHYVVACDGSEYQVK